SRFIDVEWDDERSTSYVANLQIEAYDRDGVLLEITNILANLKTSVKSVNAYINKKHIAVIQVGIEIRNTADLELIKKKIKQVQSVISISRSAH
ncbi:MAG: ACT domain-containing protein, partial [Clostridia bacterium]|nr:ACT domain-containing protein [Clostridia bacterium]